MDRKLKKNQPKKIRASKHIEIKSSSSPQSSIPATRGEVTASTNAKDHEAKTRRSYAEKKPVNSENNVQAGKRNVHSGKQKHVRKHQPPKKGSYAARKGHASKARRPNTIRNQWDGGSLQPACSNAWNDAPPEMTDVYDPLYGRHVIPRVENPQLLEAIVAEKNLTEAIKKLLKYPKKAKGVDEMTVREVCDSLLNDPLQMETLQQDIMTGNYWPNMVRRSYIPKKNGKLRALGIAIVKDRIVMTAILKAIETALPPDTWNPNSFAYTIKCSPKDAIARVDKIREDGYTWAVCLDLKAFFDNVPHDRLMAKVRALISDDRVVILVNRFLTAVVWDKKMNTKVRNRLGTVQGSAISPLLASKIYMDELDQELMNRGLCFVRYADDITKRDFRFLCPRRPSLQLTASYHAVVFCGVRHISRSRRFRRHRDFFKERQSIDGFLLCSRADVTVVFRHGRIPVPDDFCDDRQGNARIRAERNERMPERMEV